MFYELLNDGTIGRSTPNPKIAANLGLNLVTDREIVYGWNGKRYFEGEVPQKPDEKLKEEVRNVRNSYLEKYVDPYQMILRWESLSEENKKEISDYRQYLLNYTIEENWWENNPKTFDEWKD